MGQGYQRERGTEGGREEDGQHTLAHWCSLRQGLPSGDKFPSLCWLFKVSMSLSVCWRNLRGFKLERLSMGTAAICLLLRVTELCYWLTVMIYWPVRGVKGECGLNPVNGVQPRRSRSLAGQLNLFSGFRQLISKKYCWYMREVSDVIKKIAA